MLFITLPKLFTRKASYRDQASIKDDLSIGIGDLCCDDDNEDDAKEWEELID